MIRSIVTIVMLCFIQTGIAQVKIGYNAGVVNGAAILELGNNTADAPSTWKSFMPPQVDFTNAIFTNTSVWGIAGSPTTGAVVFNTGENYINGFFGPGLYCWLRGTWLPMATVLSGDKIRESLTTSIPAYDAAAVNTWVNVTATEYNNLLTKVVGALRYAASETHMNTTPTSWWWGNYTVATNTNAPKVPASHYIIAWSVRTGSNISTAVNSKLKISTQQNSGYTVYGSTLPNTGNIPAMTRMYYIMKRPEILTPLTPCFTAVYAASDYFLGVKGGGGSEYFSSGDNTSPSSPVANESYSQVIATPLRQW
jgi:hypothetical protein